MPPETSVARLIPLAEWEHLQVTSDASDAKSCKSDCQGAQDIQATSGGTTLSEWMARVSAKNVLFADVNVILRQGKFLEKSEGPNVSSRHEGC